MPGKAADQPGVAVRNSVFSGRFGAALAGVLAAGAWLAGAEFTGGQAAGLTPQETTPVHYHDDARASLPGPDLLRMVGMDAARAVRIQHKVLDPVEACLRLGESDGLSAAHGELSRLLETLRRSATARALLRVARARDVLLCLDDDTGRFAYYYSFTRLMGVNAGMPEGRRIAFLAHELAHVPQHPVYSDNRLFPPDDMILLRRIREAAAEACATQILWELKQAGYTEAWHAKAGTLYEDIAQAFLEAHRSAAPGDREPYAMRAAFDQWFKSQRRLDLYDSMTVDHLQRIAGDELGLVPPSRRLTHDFLRAIGWSSGSNYLIETPGPQLTAPYYRAELSVSNAARLEQLLRYVPAAAEPPRSKLLPASL